MAHRAGVCGEDSATPCADFGLDYREENRRFTLVCGADPGGIPPASEALAGPGEASRVLCLISLCCVPGEFKIVS
jgi:hypothetical protein